MIPELCLIVIFGAFAERHRLGRYSGAQWGAGAGGREVREGLPPSSPHCTPEVSLPSLPFLASRLGLPGRAVSFNGSGPRRKPGLPDRAAHRPDVVLPTAPTPVGI